MLRTILCIVAIATLVSYCTAGPFANPPMLHSQNGSLNVTLIVQMWNSTLANISGEFETWNGTLIPPALRLHRGDVVRITIYNAMANKTNLHFHGTEVSPLPGADDVLVEAQPMNYTEYAFQIPPEHPEGTFWYHAHPHGHTMTQLHGGLAGLLIVEYEDQKFPELQNATERLFMIKDFVTEEHEEDDNSICALNFVNGLLNSTVDIQPGELQHWRLAAMGPNCYYNFSLDGVEMYILSHDGRLVSELEKIEHYLLPPASRVELLIVGPPEGSYAFATSDIDTGEDGDQYNGTTLITLVSSKAPPVLSGDRSQRVMLNDSKLPNFKLPKAEDYTKYNVTNKRTIVFSEDTDAGTFFIDGKEYDPDRIDVYVNLGDVEEWTLENPTAELHVFHIHQVDFQVLEINGKKVKNNGHVETVNIPFADNSTGTPVPGVVKILIPFVDPLLAGRFLFHCHITEHSDKGMVGQLVVLTNSTGAPHNTQLPDETDASGSAGGALTISLASSMLLLLMALAYSL